MVKTKLFKKTNLVDFNGNANEIRAIIRVALWGIVEKIKLLDDDNNNDIIIIEKVMIDLNNNTVVDDGDNNHSVLQAELPIQFASSKKSHGFKNNTMNALGQSNRNTIKSSNDHKRKLLPGVVHHDNNKIFANEKFILPKPKLNDTLLESNVLKSYVPLLSSSSLSTSSTLSSSSVNKTQVVYVRILGISCTVPCGSSVVARIIGYDCDDISLDGGAIINTDDSDNTELKYKVNDVIDICRDRLHSLKATELHIAHMMVKNDETYLSSRDAPTDVHLKYWNQRYRLLSMYDHGIRLDPESWYSITPEAVSKHVTNACLSRARERGISIDIVMDCFSGCGGNTIPFAMKGKHVIAVDFDTIKLNNLM